MGINSYPPSSGGEISSYKTGNTAGRPSAVGSTFFDTTTNQLMIKTNTGWNVMVDPILPPTVTSATATGAGVSVAFTAPSWLGTITSYKVTSSSGNTASGASSPIVVTETVTGTYTYTVQSVTAIGASAASNSASATFTAFAATGGTISSDSTYNYNLFTSSGTWTPNISGKAYEFYVVGGGQGGSNFNAAGTSSFAGVDGVGYPSSGYRTGADATGNRNGTTGTYISWTPIAAYVGSSGGAGGTPYNGAGNYSGGSGGSGAGNGGTYNGSNATSATTYGSGGGGGQSTTTSNWGANGGGGGQVSTGSGTSVGGTGVSVTVAAGTNGQNNDAPSNKLGGNGQPGVVIIRYLK